MKQVFYILTAFSLSTAPANAQLAATTSASLLLVTPGMSADVNLQANFANNAATISWQSATLVKVRRYELEKSNDGSNFMYVTSFAGNLKQYNTADNNLSSGTTYYRIKIVDDKNNAFYSNAALINTKEEANEIRILPTQIDEKVFVWIPANTSISCAVISTADGKMVRKAVINSSNNIAAIEIKGMPAGVYNLGLQTSKGETIKLRFSKPS